MPAELSEFVFDVTGRRIIAACARSWTWPESPCPVVLTNVSMNRLSFSSSPASATGGDAGATSWRADEIAGSASGVRECQDAVLERIVEAHGGANIDISFRCSPQSAGLPRRQTRTASREAIARPVHRQDLDSMRFESGDGTSSRRTTVLWKGETFSRRISSPHHRGNTQPLCLALDLWRSARWFACCSLAVSAMILARQALTHSRCLHRSRLRGYFPLILYLARASLSQSADHRGGRAGALLVNYARWLLGGRLVCSAGRRFCALLGFPHAGGVFVGWKPWHVLAVPWRGDVWVLIICKTRRSGKGRGRPSCWCCSLCRVSTSAAEIQVSCRRNFGRKLVMPKPTHTSVVAFEPVHTR